MSMISRRIDDHKRCRGATSASPNTAHKKIQRSSISVTRAVKELSACYDELIDTKVSIFSSNLDRLTWIISHGDHDDMNLAMNQVCKINDEIDLMSIMSTKFSSVVSSLNLEDIDANYKLYDFIPKDKVISILNRYVTKIQSKGIVTTKDTICSKCKMMIRLISGVVQCPRCYNDLISRDIFTPNESNIKSMTDRKDTLEETMDCYEGIQKRTFSNEFKAYIDKSLEERGQDPKTVKKDVLRRIIKQGRYSQYFCDLNLLHNTYTGSILPNISHLRSKLKYRNELMKEVYKKLHPNHVGKYLHGQFLLKIMLQMEGYKYKKEDFSSELKMRPVTMRHNREALEVCEVLKKMYPTMNWDFNYTS